MELINALFTLLIAFRDGAWPNKGFEEVFSPEHVKTLLKVSPKFEKPIKGYLTGKIIDPSDIILAIQDTIIKYSASKAPKASFIATLKGFASYFRSESATALRSLTKLSSQSQVPAIRQAFLNMEIKLDQGPIRKQLARIVPKLGGANGQLLLDAEESKAAKLKNPELYKNYLKLRGDFGKIWKAALSNIVRSSGQHTIPYVDAIKALDHLGLDHTMPAGFTGKVDADGKWYTKDDKLINGVPAAVMFPRVFMNPHPSPDAEWVFKAVRPDGAKANAFYTMETIKRNQSDKFEKVANFDPDVTRKKWLPLIKNFSVTNKEAQCAIIIELLYRTSNRIGSPQAYNATSGFGVSSLLVKHVTVMSSGAIKVTYPGKDAVKTTFVVMPNDDAVAGFLCRKVFPTLLKGKSPRDPLFALDRGNGRYIQIKPSSVNSLFRRFAPGLTVHKLRTSKGTKLFSEAADVLISKFANKKKQPSASEVTTMVKYAAGKAGKALNHVRRSQDGAQSVTPATALANYIDPNVVASFYRKFNAPIPKWLETKVETSSRR
jgi:hypothetical protein